MSITFENGFSIRPLAVPIVVSANLVFDLDAANYSAVPTNGTTVAGTGAYTITTSNTGASLGWNSANGGVFRKSSTGTSDMFYASGINYSTASQPWTVFMAYKWDGVTGGRLLNANSSSPDFLMGLWSSSGTTRMNIAFNGSFVGANSTTADTAWHFIWMTNDGLNTTNSSKSYIATNIAPTTFTSRTGSSGFNGLRLFGRFSTSTTSSEPVTGDVAFVKVYDGALTLTDIQTLHAAYKSRVGY